ncbi:pilus assembly protein TadG-related protein [Stagnimonas aquatica]|uniref:pilus assembly protein TadG-related protein n=1 Tax=Stagnimonas aquatica TaxID=2689987 RepID=UPI0013155AE7|nr:pilus assembly protein TadG-related protein [Stagnimonas aquatica]
MTSKTLHPRAPRHRQAGAVAVFAALTLVALLSALALAVDVGRLYYAQRDTQRLADVAALDASRVVSGCASSSGVPGSKAQALAEVMASLARNSSSTKDYTVSVQIGRQLSNPGGLRGFQELGDGDDRLDAVRVRISRQQPTRIFPLVTGNRDASLTAVAVGSQQAVGAFNVGSGLLSLNTQQSALLNPLLRALLCPNGGAACTAGINLTAADYAGLANAHVSLGNLLAGATELGLGVQDVSDLLNLQLTLPQWLGVVGNGLEFALTGTGNQVSSGVSGLVQGLAGVAESNGAVFGLGELLNMTGLALNQPVSDLLAALPFIDGMTLLNALGQAATAAAAGGPSSVAIPGLGLSVPGVADVKVFLKVVEPQQPGLGAVGSEGAVARTAQVRLQIRISAGQLLNGLKAALEALINSLLGILAILGVHSSVAILPSSLNLGVDVDVASAEAQLEALQCPRASSNNGHPIASLSASTAVADVQVGTFSGTATAANPQTLSPTGNLPLATVAVNAGLLGSTNLALGLELTSVSVGSQGQRTLSPISSYTERDPGTDSGPPYYQANNPVSNMNPQTIGSPVNVGVHLGVTSQQTGSGLVGGLVGLVSSIVNSVNTVILAPLLTLVNSLATALINPLLQLLGVQLGTATVTMEAVTVNQPQVISQSLTEVEN